MKRGKHYELKTAEVMQALNPQAHVLQGIRVIGKLTKISREIDVQLIDPSDYEAIVFECKDHAAKVDIELVEALVTKLKDLNLRRGTIVSNSGFTLGAQRAAAAHGIDLLAIIDTGDETVRTHVFMPHIVEDTYMGAAGLHLEGIKAPLALGDLHLISVVTDKRAVPWTQILSEHWNLNELKNTPRLGEHELTLRDVLVSEKNANQVRVDVLKIRYIVKRRYYKRNLRLIDTQGIYDTATNTYRTQSIRTEIIKVSDFEDPDLWEQMEEDAALSQNVSVRMTVVSPMSDESKP